MNDFLDYDKKYPDLIPEVIKFFSQNRGSGAKRTIGDFCEE